MEKIIENSELAKSYDSLMGFYSGDMSDIANNSFLKMMGELAQKLSEHINDTTKRK